MDSTAAPEGVDASRDAEHDAPRVERLLTARELALMLGLRPERVRGLARTGLLPHVRLGRQLRFAPTVVRAWIADGGTALPGGWRASPAPTTRETTAHSLKRPGRPRVTAVPGS